MIGKEFIYLLVDKNNMFYQIDRQTGYKLSTTAVPLEFSPDGWEQISISNTRNTKYFGVDRKLTIPYNFVEDGAAILKTIVYKYGIETPVNLIICKQQLTITDTTYGYWYKQLLKCEVDTSTFSHNGAKVTCTMAEGGLPKFLKANESTDYQINLYGDSRVINLAMDGINLANTINYKALVLDYTYLRGYAPAIFMTSQDGTSPGTEILSSTAEAYSDSTAEYIVNSDNYILKNISQNPIEINIAGNLNFFSEAVSTQNYALYFVQTGMVTNYIFNRSIFNGPYNAYINLTITLQPGDKLFLLAELTPAIGVPTISFNDDALFSIRLASKFQTTYIPCYRAIDLFSQLISNISGGTLTVDSSLLKGTDYDKVFTSGDGLRGLSNSDMKISLSTFYSFFNCFRDVGITSTADGVVLLEKRQDMVDYSSVSHLGEVSNPQITIRTQDRFNTLKIGFPDTNQQDVNGKQAFCTTSIFSLGALRVTNTLDKTTRVIADCFSAENTRITFAGQTTTDSRQDNDIYVFHIERTLQPAEGGNAAHYKLDRSLNTYVTAGLLQPSSVFNLAFSIANCIKNNGPYFRSCLSDSDTSVLQFISTLENQTLVMNTPNGVLRDNASYAIGTLGDRYFKSVEIQFDTEGDYNLLDDLDADPSQVFDFTLNGSTYVVIADEVAIQPNTNEKQTYKMICGKDTDLTPLINYYGESN